MTIEDKLEEILNKLENTTTSYEYALEASEDGWERLYYSEYTSSQVIYVGDILTLQYKKSVNNWEYNLDYKEFVVTKRVFDKNNYCTLTVKSINFK
jgi:hypothetical protein